jgi:hypothetical protein
MHASPNLIDNRQKYGMLSLVEQILQRHHDAMERRLVLRQFVFHRDATPLQFYEQM